MSDTAKSSWFSAKLFSPMTEDDTCQLMFSPKTVAACPTHCCIAIPAKLEPVALSAGKADATVEGANEANSPRAVTTKSVPSFSRAPLRRQRDARMSAEAAVDIILGPLVMG